jgi:adenosylcobinamide-GDP ribazoletransferase
MRTQIKIFLTAVMFLTRIRVPRNIDHRPEYLQRSPVYFPVVGWIVGVACAGVFLLAAEINVDVAIAFSIIAGIMITGAFHEDGFADTCDGFGGGWTKEKILLIMKDSRIGAFGAIGLVCMLGTKFLLIQAIVHLTPVFEQSFKDTILHYRYVAFALIAAHSLSRLAPVFILQTYKYASDPDTSKSKPLANQNLPAAGLVFCILFGLTPFIFLSWYFLLAIIPVLITTLLMARYFRKWIGGYTGDCLGAVQQVTEIIFYLSYIIIWKYLAA